MGSTTRIPVNENTREELEALRESRDECDDFDDVVQLLLEVANGGATEAEP